MTRASWLTRMTWRLWWWLQNRVGFPEPEPGEADVRQKLYGAIPKARPKTPDPVPGMPCLVHSAAYPTPLPGVVVFANPVYIRVMLNETGLIVACHKDQVQVL